MQLEVYRVNSTGSEAVCIDVLGADGGATLPASRRVHASASDDPKSELERTLSGKTGSYKPGLLCKRSTVLKHTARFIFPSEVHACRLQDL